MAREGDKEFSPQAADEGEPTPSEVTGAALSAGGGGKSDEPPRPESEEGEEPEEEPEIDLEEGVEEPATVVSPPTGIPRKIENVRAQIARALVAVLAVVILFSFLTLWMIPSRIDQMETLLTIIFGPLVALVSGAVGYYFGGKLS